MWRAESYQHYAVLRRILPDDRIYMVSPQFLIPLFTFFKSVMQRMSESGLTWESPQSTPHGFVGIGLLIQICDRITLYGFEEPTREPGSKYHYYNKIEPLDPHANDVEFACTMRSAIYGYAETAWEAIDGGAGVAREARGGKAWLRQAGTSRAFPSLSS